jgi:predicted dehydrogenase
MMSQIGHLPFFLSDPRCHVVGIAESRRSLVEALGQDRRIRRIVPHHRELLADPQIDAVVISLPRAATAPVTLEALTAGKHVLAEKPMALTLEDARRLVDAAQSKHLTYAVGFMKRYDPSVQEARRLFRELCGGGRLGRLLVARFYNFSKVYAVSPPQHTRPQESRTERFAESALVPSWLPQKWRARYGWFMNAASHDLNLLHFFFDGDLEVCAASSPSDAAVSALLRYADATVHLEVAKSAVGVWHEGAEFLFENGRLSLEIPSPMAVERVGKVTLEENAGGYRARDVAVEAGWSFARQAKSFVDALSGTAVPLSSGEEALRDMVLNDAIWRKIVSHD